MVTAEVKEDTDARERGCVADTNAIAQALTAIPNQMVGLQAQMLTMQAHPAAAILPAPHIQIEAGQRNSDPASPAPTWTSSLAASLMAAGLSESATNLFTVSAAAGAAQGGALGGGAWKGWTQMRRIRGGRQSQDPQPWQGVDVISGQG